MDVEIILDQRPAAITLPKEAVLHSTSGGRAEDHHVFVVENGSLHRRSVKLGTASATRFEIASGLKAGEKVAIPGEQPLEEGLKVRMSP